MLKKVFDAGLQTSNIFERSTKDAERYFLIICQ